MTAKLTPREHGELTPEALGDGYNEATLANVRLPFTEKGYGLLLVEDEQGAHFTAITEDVEYHRLLVKAKLSGNLDELDTFEVPEGKYDRIRAGWPDEWEELDGSWEPYGVAPA